MDTYKQWLESEKDWIGIYCKKVKVMSVLKVVPATIIILALFFGGLAAVSGNVSANAVIEGAMGGLFIGIFVCLIYIVILFPALSPKRYVKKIDKAVSKAGLDDFCKEQLAREFLEAENNVKKTFSFDMKGPNSRNTPARFVVSEHYAMLEGGFPYAIIVKLQDIKEIKPSQENKTAYRRSGNVHTSYFFTLYTIQFYRFDRAQRGLSGKDLPDEAMGFMDKEIRDRAISLLEKNKPEY
ncbi:MAG: hypothetical protein K2K35_05150 [Lachnospiraceae bacterium]|nr:hypothetical protein [Lachnospiraceae bacterium]